MKNESSEPLEKTTDYDNVTDHIQNKPNIYRTISMIDITVIIFCLIISTAHYFSSPKNPQYTVEEYPAITIIRETSPAETSPVTEKTEKATITVTEKTEKATITEEPAVDYEKIYNDFIKNDLIQANGLAALNPYKPTGQKKYYADRLIPDESLGLVSAYISDFNNDNIPELISVTLTEDTENYIWKIQSFSYNNKNDVIEKNVYNHKLKKKNIYIYNAFKSEIANGYMIISDCYTQVEGGTRNIVVLKLTDLSLENKFEVETYTFGTDFRITIDGIEDEYCCKFDEKIVYLNNKVSQAFNSLGLNYSNVSVLDESGKIFTFDDSFTLTHYDVKYENPNDYVRSDKIIYPNDYSGLYSLLGKEKSSEVLSRYEPEETEQYNYTDQGYAYVNTSEGSLNLRSSPSTSSDVLASIPKGTCIKVYSFESRDWYYTNYENQNGYVSADFISFKELEKTVERIDQGSITDFDLDNDGTNDRIDIWYDKNATMCPINWDVYYSSKTMETLTFPNGADHITQGYIVRDNNIGELYIAGCKSGGPNISPIMKFQRMSNQNTILEITYDNNGFGDRIYKLNGDISSFEELEKYLDNIEILYGGIENNKNDIPLF